MVQDFQKLQLVEWFSWLQIFVVVAGIATKDLF